MPEHDFAALYEKYPDVISQMPNTFTSHQFFQRLAQQNQTLYIEALYAYRHATHRGGIAPFRVVHDVLAKRLNKYPNLVQKIRSDAPSIDIFGKPSKCTEWQRL